MDPCVLVWAEGTEADRTFISALTWLETRRGVARLAMRDSEQAQRLRHAYQTQVLVVYHERTLAGLHATAHGCICPLDVLTPMR
ncbi:hypothetical protein ACTUSR_03245 [Pantoea stewartii subsp. indologenes]|uniref:hypothetical protein n=1 Tax=Pantoea stewartii TaxID=66269 RepID=UPI003FA4B71F